MYAIQTPKTGFLLTNLIFSVFLISGYGHISPSSYGGQLFFIFYSIFGIPLCITMLIGMGERLSRPYKNLETSNYFRHHKTTKMLLMILYTLLYFVIFSFIPAAIIMQFEDWTYLQSLYFTVVTLTTVGFGDFVPGTHLFYICTYPLSRMLTIYLTVTSFNSKDVAQVSPDSL